MRFFTSLLSFALLASAQTVPSGMVKGPSVEGISEYQLANGLRVLLFPDQSKPKVTVNMTYLVGSRHEGYGETGMAHLLEHMLYKQTPTRPDIKKDIADRGADFNGSTSWDRTNYFETVTASDENLKWAIELEADRMLNCKMEKSILDPEMTVVRNEFEMRENSPDGMLFQRSLEAAYAYHNYGKMPIGARSDIENVPIERLAAFYHRYYQPDNAVLMVSGAFDPSKALALVAQTFGALPRPDRKLIAPYTVEPTQDGERSVTLRRVGDVQAMTIVYHTPAGSHPDQAALEVLSSILGETPSGRLYKGLVDSKKAVSANMGNEQLHDPSFLASSVRLRQDQSMDEAKTTALKIIEDFAKEPPSKEEVDRAKTRVLKNIELMLANSEQVGIFLSEFMGVGDWRTLYLLRDQIKNVTDQDVVRVAKAYLKESNRTLGVFVPTPKPDRAEIPATPDVVAMLKDYRGGAAISEGEAFDPAPANVESRVKRSRLANGMKVTLLPKKTRGGTVVAMINLHFGEEKSVFGMSPQAGMAANLLMRGTKNKSRQQIQDEMDKLKAQISVTGGPTGATANIQTLEANLPGALRLTAEILREPSFPEDQFEQVKQQRIANIETNKSEPMTLAMQGLQRHLNPYPKGDVRYVSTPQEQIDDTKTVTLEQVRAFYGKFFGASHAEMVVSGQFDAAAIGKLAGELFGDWKSPSPYKRIISSYGKAEAINKAIETPDKQNAVLAGGMRVKMSDEDPDYPAMTMANYILGGTPLASRLSKRVRDKEGLSYGIGSQFGVSPKEDNAQMMSYAFCAPQNAPKVEASLNDELRKIAKEGFTTEEVEASKKSWLQERQVGRAQDQQLARTIATREHYDRTMMWDAELEKKVGALTAEQVSAAFRRYVDAGNFSIVKAGDFKKAGVYQN